jgi:NAD(P)-dependent dehydrogenase (short-subunit alcohol dehydrogenase family)
VVLADIDAEALDRVKAELSARHSPDVIRAVVMDVTREDAVASAFAAAAREFGGIDILVSNAGIASSAPIEDTSLALWNRNMDILSTGYFLVSREAFRLMQRQGMGGSVIFVASKNGLAPRRARPPIARPRRPRSTLRAASRSRVRRMASG